MYSHPHASHRLSIFSHIPPPLHQVKSSLSAVRMFGKLLLRRLPGDDKMNRELAKDILIQSDRLVDLLLPIDSMTRLPSLESGAGGSRSPPFLLQGAPQDGERRARGSGARGEMSGAVDVLEVNHALDGVEGDVREVDEEMEFQVPVRRQLCALCDCAIRVP